MCPSLLLRSCSLLQLRYALLLKGGCPPPGPRSLQSWMAKSYLLLLCWSTSLYHETLHCKLPWLDSPYTDASSSRSNPINYRESTKVIFRGHLVLRSCFPPLLFLFLCHMGACFLKDKTGFSHSCAVPWAEPSHPKPATLCLDKFPHLSRRVRCLNAPGWDERWK